MKSALHLLPPLFLERLQKIFPPSVFHKVCNAMATARPVAFRCNFLKTTERELVQELQKEGFLLQRVQELPGAFVLKNRTQTDLEKTKAYLEGKLYLQGLSSQIPPLVLDPKPGERVLDLAAAPGGKTCQIAAAMRNEGEILAVEKDPVRAERLVFNLKRQGVLCVRVHRADGRFLKEEKTGFFDRVLLDAPCSAEGKFHLQNPRSFAYWDLSVVQKNARLQRSLLKTAWRLLRPGGILVYSTCALSPEENEATVAELWQETPPPEVEDSPVFGGAFCGLTRWDERVFPEGLKKARRLAPSRLFEGFFWVKLRKPKS